MKHITLVTGNPGKLAEWQRMFPADIQLDAADVDLDEIQSLDLDAIAVDKARRAYEQLKRPVIVEDVSAGLDNLGGLPGPFIKFFEHKLGLDALRQMAAHEGDPATVVCTVAYYNGTHAIIGRGVIHGKAVDSRGDGGFGFDKNFVPNGHEHTYGEMTDEEKDAVSHRSIAIKDLVEKLKSEL
jgi:non-canonical purine NTP pyrophosphatase (RdgB/HAM1 family)